MSKELIIYTDGACSGNPGEAAVGYVIKEHDQVMREGAKSIGLATNNIAEYSALIYALQEAAALQATRLKIFTDSELMYKQVIGKYKVKNENVKQLFDQVQQLASRFEKIEINHIPREQNTHADKLATDILKKKKVKVVAPSFFHDGEESPSSKG